MTNRRLILIFAATTALSALALTAARARDEPRVATGFVANVVCSETFVSGADPDRVFSDTTAAMPGVGLIAWALDYKVDRTRRDVVVTLLGLGRSHAVYREGFGCYLDHGGAVADISLPATESKPAAAVAARDRRIRDRRATVAATGCRARPRLRRARQAAVPPH